MSCCRGWGTSLSRANSSRACHTSYPVSVRRPALSDWASFRHHLAMMPLPFSLPSAPLLPGAGTCTPQVLDHVRHTHAPDAPPYGASPSRRKLVLLVFVRGICFRRGGFSFLFRSYICQHFSKKRNKFCSFAFLFRLIGIRNIIEIIYIAL
jgi:hypothetical protein